MTASGPSGSEPPLRTADPTGGDTGFFDSGNTRVFFQPTEVAAGGDDTLDGGDDELDSEFAPQPRKRLGKLTIGLAALLVAGAGFLGGLQVQQHEGSSSTAANPFAADAARRGTGTGTGGGGFGGFGGGGTGTGGTGTGRTGTGGTGGTGTGGTGTGGTGTGGTGTGGGTASIPAVIGQIVSVSGDTVVVKNLGGQQVTVKLSGTTTITQTGTAADLKAGQNVTVSGTTGADGTVTATAVGTH